LIGGHKMAEKIPAIKRENRKWYFKKDGKWHQAESLEKAIIGERRAA
jgi:hypothetical protein